MSVHISTHVRMPHTYTHVRTHFHATSPHTPKADLQVTSFLHRAKNVHVYRNVKDVHVHVCRHAKDVQVYVYRHA